MMAADHESEGLGVRSSSVGYCAFPTEKATLKIGGWIWMDISVGIREACIPSRLLVVPHYEEIDVKLNKQVNYPGSR